MIPYLIRRAEENSSVKGQTSRELSLINHELKIEGWYNPCDKRSSEALREKLLFALNEAKS